MRTSEQRPPNAWCLPVLGILFYAKVVYLALFVVVPWDVPDEIGHLGYIQHIAQGDGFPVFWQTRMDEQMWRSMAGPEGPPADYNWIAQHPPLYYTLMVPAYWVGALFSDDFTGPLYAVRLASGLFMVVALWVVYHLARRFAESEVVAFCLAVMTASVPLFGQTAAGVNNDTLIVCLSMLLALRWTLFSEQPNPRNLLLVGLVVGLCGITKYTLLLVMAPVSALVLWRFVQAVGWRVRPMLGFVALAWVPVVAWTIRNVLVTGRAMPTALDHLTFDSPTSYSLFEFFRAYPYFTHTFRSFWGIWGWHGVGQDLELTTLHLPASHQFIYAALLSILAVCALIVLFSKLLGFNRKTAFASAIVAAVAVLVMYQWALFPNEAFYITILLYLTLISICLVLVTGTQGVWLTTNPITDWRVRLPMEAILLSFFFLSVIVYQMHDYSNEGGALRGTHGRYFFANSGILLVAWVLPALRSLRTRASLVIALAALMVLAEWWLLLNDVIPYLKRDA